MNCFKVQRLLSVLFGAMVVFSCSENKEAVRELNVYFDLDSLLDKQIEALSEGGYPVTKKVTMDGETEIQTNSFDSAQWVSEFVIVRDFDLNKPYNVGAYTESRNGGSLTYRLDDQTLEAPVQYFSIVRKGDEMEISSEYYEDKSIYQHRRKLLLRFRDDLLRSYEVRGFQKMIMKDTIHYRIGGEVEIQ